MKKLLLVMLLSNILIAHPLHEITNTLRFPFSLAPELELRMRVTRLITEGRKARVHPQDLTLVAILEVFQNMQALAAFGQNPNITISDCDIRRAIKYMDNESLKTKIL